MREPVRCRFVESVITSSNQNQNHLSYMMCKTVFLFRFISPVILTRGFCFLRFLSALGVGLMFGSIGISDRMTNNYPVELFSHPRSKTRKMRACIQFATQILMVFTAIARGTVG